jgi:hypothetical protein
MTMQTTPASELADKIEQKRYDTFTFPILDITIKYRKPDLLKLSFNNSLPSALAAVVVNGYKEAVGGADLNEYKEQLKDTKIDVNDALIKDIGTKGYQLLKELSVSHKFLDVPESDFNSVPIPIIAWVDVPEEDAIAFLLNLISRGQVAQTATGGEISMEDVTSFPSGGSVPERNTDGKRRKAVRKSA